MSITNRPPKQRGVSEISLHFFDDCYLETVIYGLIWNTLYLLKLYFPINLISIPALIFFNLFPLNYFGYALSLLRCDWTPFFRLCSIISYCKKLVKKYITVPASAVSIYDLISKYSCCIINCLITSSDTDFVRLSRPQMG